MDGGLQMKKQGRLCFKFFIISFIADMIVLCNRIDKYLLQNLWFKVLDVIFLRLRILIHLIDRYEFEFHFILYHSSKFSPTIVFIVAIQIY